MSKTWGERSDTVLLGPWSWMPEESTRRWPVQSDAAPQPKLAEQSDVSMATPNKVHLLWQILKKISKLEIFVTFGWKIIQPPASGWWPLPSHEPLAQPEVDPGRSFWFHADLSTLAIRSKLVPVTKAAFPAISAARQVSASEIFVMERCADSRSLSPDLLSVGVPGFLLEASHSPHSFPPIDWKPGEKCSDDAFLTVTALETKNIKCFQVKNQQVLRTTISVKLWTSNSSRAPPLGQEFWLRPHPTPAATRRRTSRETASLTANFWAKASHLRS